MYCQRRLPLLHRCDRVIGKLPPRVTLGHVDLFKGRRCFFFPFRNFAIDTALPFFMAPGPFHQLVFQRGPSPHTQSVVSSAGDLPETLKFPLGLVFPPSKAAFLLLSCDPPLSPDFPLLLKKRRASRRLADAVSLNSPPNAGLLLSMYFPFLTSYDSPLVQLCSAVLLSCSSKLFELWLYVSLVPTLQLSWSFYPSPQGFF